MLAAGIAFALWQLVQDPVDPGNRASASGIAERVPGGAAPAPSLPPLPDSLAGAEAEGDLRADATGRFAPGPEALQLFDFFLSASAEESAATIRLRVEAEVATRLPETAQAEALGVFDRYVVYLARRAAIPEEVDPSDLEQRYRLERALRRDVFGVAIADALFAEQERIEEVAVERRRVMSDPTLNDRQRIERLAELQARLPERVRRAEAAAYAPLRLARDEEELRAAGGSEAEIQALRDDHRADAADPATGLDRARESWAKRMADYRSERDRVMHHTANAPEQAKAAFLQRVRERHFTPDELPRVEALDRIELRDRSLGRAIIVEE